MASSGPGQVEENGNNDHAPIRRKTQEDQDKDDEKARNKALKDLVQSWQDRLQLITLLTTFLASVEASMLQVTFPSDPLNSSRCQQASNAGYMAALVLHLYASLISFFASFFLIRFKVKEAKREEQQVEGNSAQHSQPETKGRTESSRHSPVWSANPQLVTTGPFQRQPPVNLLSRCHTLCMVTTAVGFILAIIGTLCYAWAGQSTSVAIITSVTIGICLISCIVIVVPQQSAPSSHLFTYH
ncbi:hypothetical protein BT96DRAFT_1029994 [Gymnopus androsaceus JB14]|uniref:Transmembrane protein n=1 Tax=Gymnopus androsaceus JB14 TaxID=1447944 RepID=A0A6A4IVX6_9AGAR|nr:hypothetical protein BT96DRAFT_1029994 [Gymnopus androsaceus JB14]